MGGLLAFLSGPLKGLMDGATGIIGKFVASPEEKTAATFQLAQLQAAVMQAVRDADAKFAEMQQNVIIAEAKSDSVLARNWRPILMLVFTAIIANTYMVAPIFHTPTTPLPDQMWDLLKLGVTGYIVGRSVEKAGPSIAQVFKGGT